MRNLMVIVLGLLLAASLQTQASARSIEDLHGYEPRFLPPVGTELKNIKTDFGAVGDGKTDDTAAFQKAIGGDAPRSIYIPAGTYLISQQLRYGVNAAKKKRTLLIGESQSKTILKLADGSAGFGDRAKPLPFVHTRHPKQQGEQNMAMFLYHLTIEIGKNNPGAIGLSYHSNNTGAIRDVAIRASDPVNHRGAIGLACSDWEVGPASARYLTVDGFETGIALTRIGNYFTMEHVTVRNCDTGVVANTSSIRDLRTDNCKLPLRVQGMVVLLESQLRGKGPMAVDLAEGSLLARDLQTAGYAVAIKGPGDAVTGPKVAFFASEAVKTNWPSGAGSSAGAGTGADSTLNLPIEQSPEMQYPAADQWAVVMAKGDISDALQKAIDSGARDIAISGTGGTISKTIHLRNKVQRIMGFGVTPIIYRTGAQPVFRLDDGAAPVVILELLYGNYGSQADTVMEQASKRTLVFRHGSGSYRTAPEGYGGKVFMESNVTHPLVFTKVHAWLRDMNTERGGLDGTNIINDGGVVWMLGHKTEDFATKILTKNGGWTELLGGTYRQNWDQKDFAEKGITPANLPPLFIVENAHVSMTYVSWGPNKPFEVLVRETRDGQTLDLDRKTHGGSAVLFSGFTQRPPVK